MPSGLSFSRSAVRHTQPHHETLLTLSSSLRTGITFNFPGYYPVNDKNMNYTCAAVGVIMSVSLVTWFTTGRKRFRGPVSGGVVIEGVRDGGVEVVQGDGDGDGEEVERGRKGL